METIDEVIQMQGHFDIAPEKVVEGIQVCYERAIDGTHTIRKNQF